MIVWTGTYTEKDGTVLDAVIEVDGDKLSSWFGHSRHSNSAFRNARKQQITVERLSGGVRVTLKCQPTSAGVEDL